MQLKEMMARRKKIGISLLELAALSGLTESYLEKLESGSIQPLEGDLKRLQRALAHAERDRKNDADESSGIQEY